MSLQVSEELLRVLLARTGADAKALAAQISAYEALHTSLKAHWREEEVLTARHKQERKTLDEKYRALQASCDHPAPRYIPDASGGSDSEEHCEICGAQGRGLRGK